ncbi:MAG: glycosyltransferase family 9 protein [Candidatus Ozemobacteraceae bacterium]
MAIHILIRLTAMGDALLAIPTARALAEQGIEVHWVLSRKWAGLAAFLPAHIHFLDNASSLLPMARRLRRLHPAATHDLQGKPASMALSYLLGTSVDRYRKRDLGENFRAGLGRYPLRGSDPLPVWRRYLSSVGIDHLPDSHINASLNHPLPFLQEARTYLYQFVSPHSSPLLLHPGASKVGKLLPDQALQLFSSQLPGPLILIGDPPFPGQKKSPASPTSLPSKDPNHAQCSPLFQKTASASRDIPPLIDLRGTIPLRLLPGIMSLSRGIITTDSGPMHLARAVGIPLMALFFQTDPSLGFAPIPGDRQLLVSRDLPCKPCSLHGGRAVCPEGTWACRDLDWADLAAQASRLFG